MATRMGVAADVLEHLLEQSREGAFRIYHPLVKRKRRVGR